MLNLLSVPMLPGRARRDRAHAAPGWTALAAVALLATSAAAQASWIRARPTLEARSTKMAYDPARQRVVLFGGLEYRKVTNDTWEWDGTSWSVRPTPVAPAPRTDHALAYDPVGKRMLLFGGYATVPANTSYGDTWAWDGFAWTQLSPVHGPGPRQMHAMATDSARSRVVLFGGYVGLIAAQQDTWEWDGNDWIQSAASGPAARAMHGMAFDPGRARTVLFGGGSWTVSTMNDTWEWDGSSWTQRVPTTSPPARTGAGFAYDTLRRRAVLFGGSATNVGALGDTWEWDGSNWQPVAPATSPTARNLPACAFDAARGRTLVFSGDAIKTSDTWEWDGTNWALRASGPPVHETDYAMVDDIQRGRVVLVASVVPATPFPTANAFVETWEWDGSTWTLRTPATRPMARRDFAMSYDLLRGRTVFFGNGAVTTTETWEWDGNNWTLMVPVTSPMPRSGHAMTFDLQRRKTVLFSGLLNTVGDTWEWDGSNWVQVFTANAPIGRTNHCLVHSLSRGRTVLFGGAAGSGGGILADTWEYVGGNWILLAPATSPPARYRAAATDDPSRGRVVVHGGNDGTNYLTDTWEWDGVSWFQTSLGSTPALPYPRPMAYDHQRGYTILRADATTWLYGKTVSVVAAGATGYGAACAGTNGLPRLGTGLPWLGNPALRLDLRAGLGGTGCALGLSAASASLPIGGGCTLLIAAPVVAFSALSNAGGHASWPLAVPPTPVFVGGVLYAQGFALDPLGAAGGLVLSDALALTIGY